MRTRERELKAVRESLALLVQPQRVQRADAEAMQLLQAKLTEWREILRAHVTQARQIVRKLLVDRTTFTSDREARRYAFRIPGTLSRFSTG